MSENQSPYSEEMIRHAAKQAAHVLGDIYEDDRPHDDHLPDTEHLTPEHVLTKSEFHEQADRKVAESLESGKPLSLILIDIDGFKSINDELSHERGDEVIEDLKGLFQKLAESFRSEPRNGHTADIIGFGAAKDDNLPDISIVVDDNPELEAIVSSRPAPGHIGGDEFAVLIDEDETGAKAVEERLRSIFEEYINLPENASLRELNIGMAIGRSQLSESKSQMFTDADHAMYENKIDNIPDLTDEQKRSLRSIALLANDAEIRIRDLPKYFLKLAKMDQTA